MTLPPENIPIQSTAEPPIKRLFKAVQQRWLDSSASLFPRRQRQKHSHQAPAEPGASEKRRHPRIPLKNTQVHVTDGCLFATAAIDNISANGICLRNLPEQLYRSSNQLTVFSSDNPGLPVLHIAPRWQRTGWNGKTIGAQVLNISETWQLFFIHAASRLDA